MHYLIDGYNYLHRARLMRDGPTLEALRSLLARRVAPLASQPGDRVTIFWDARMRPRGGASRLERVAGVDMVFCDGNDGADGAILAYVRAAADAGSLCVVTSDGDIARPAKQLGAAVRDVRDAERLLFPEPSRAPRAGRDAPLPDDGDEKPPPPGKGGVAEWLEYFGASEDEAADA